ncbi:hypothetical protein A605_10210 [Corynebacterium halotolerans YIM 70093 = DSM 44683]|uniref:Uncharacterized protein n=2 Tax=Corynebacterium halotolerans TaxID=225326 RepID=M1NU88_9CORY|nr:hypothetical protein A605_10210 [Corynebacterium halotolerans YIM 70093 = DSM 44683]
MYSRALWVGSHVAGALFKNRHPETFWTAEFSDPLRFGVEGEPRQGDLVDNEVAKTLRRIISNRGFQDLEIKSLFDLVEAATMVLADEVIFTNQNQMTYMLSAYRNDFRTLVENKAIVRPHPVPSSAAYTAVPTNYCVNPERVNIGYFGSFYVNRGLGDVFTSIMNMKLEDRRRITLHIFCNTVEEARKQVLQWGLQDVIKINPYLPYMEFLNASTKFDVLLVNDVAKGVEQDLNPFLPSKISDYRGSGAKIWGLVDEGSPLSKQPLDFKSPVANSAAILNTLQEVVQSFDSALGTAQEIEADRKPMPRLE